MNSEPLPRRRLWPWLMAMLSGVLLALAFPPIELSGLIFVALAPLLWALWQYRSRRRAGLFRFLAGYLAGFVYFTMTFWWIGELGPLYEMPGLRLLPAALALYLALYPAVWAWFAGWVAGGHFHVEPVDPLAPFSRPPLLSSLRNLGIGILLAAAWTALEWVRGWLFTGFGWNGLGVALYSELALIQIAEFTGVGGPTFLVVLCNVIGVITILRLRAEIGRTRIRPHFDFALTMAVVVMVFLFGVHTLRRHGQEVPKASILRAYSVQPNTSQAAKLRGSAEDVMQSLTSIALQHQAAAQCTPPPHLVLWPEACLPGGITLEENRAFVLEMLKDVPAILLGTDDINRDGPGDDHNSVVFMLRGDVKPTRFYDKMHLVPFGEYVPLRPVFGWLPDDILNSDFLRGAESKIFDLPDPGLKIGPLICFEDTDGDLARKPVLMGAHVLINITNDGWFGRSSEPYAHLHNSVFRAVENRRPLIRCTNTGVTAEVSPVGLIEKWAEPFTESGSGLREVRYYPGATTTFYTRHGELFSKLCAALAMLAILLRLWLTRSPRKTL